MRPIRLAMIGCGSIAQFHLKTILADADVEVTALVSTNRERGAQASARVPRARMYQSYQEMYREEQRLDAVFVCVPPDSHGDAELMAAERGIHLFVEKPVELDLERARLIDSRIKASSIISSVAYQERYRPGLADMRAHIQRETAGVAYGWFLIPIPGVAWWRRKARSGGQIVEQSTHIVDLFRWFFGEPRLVFSQPVTGMIKNLDGYDIEDASSATIAFQNGVVATVFSGCYLTESAGGSVGLRVVCRDAFLDYTWEKEIRIGRLGKTEIREANEDSRKAAVVAFLDAVHNGSAAGIQSTYGDAVRTLELTLAANRSMATGLPVTL